MGIRLLKNKKKKVSLREVGARQTTGIVPLDQLL